ncbi:MAG: triphosphoribosyl-dephospho-CoA synthase [Archaeoglobi archaeon]|nr:triphosphoribosyl-dephospho-CoA synthase [Archaeoglobi archaeon]
MFESPEKAAVSAVLSMLLEVSASPKPGNVDRDHDFHDLRYEHFLASASASFPVFVRIAQGKLGVGEGVFELVRTTSELHLADNVHFGAFLLLSPLVASLGDAGRARELVESTTWRDSIAVKRAFDMSKARVVDAHSMDLRSDEVEREIEEKGLNLADWMRLAPEENFIAKEYVTGFRLSLTGKERIMEFYGETEDVNRAIVLCYLSFLSELEDPLIIAKRGRDVAVRVREMAGEALEVYESTGNFAVFEELDLRVRGLGVNPGSVADLVISSIYLALAEGWRF